MKGIVKCIIAGGVILAVGVIVLIIGLALNGWKFQADIEFTTQTYTAKDDNTAIDIEFIAGTIKTEFYDGDKIYVEYPVAKQFKTTVSESDGTLHLETERKKLVWFGSINIPETIIKLPENVVFDVEFDMSAGTVKLAGGKFGKVDIDMSAGTFNAGAMDCSSLKLKMSAGTVNIDEISCPAIDLKMSAGTIKVDKLTTDDAKLKMSAGTAKFNFTGSQDEYSISTDVSAGSCNVSNQRGTTGKHIDIDMSAGTVKVNFGV